MIAAVALLLCFALTPPAAREAGGALTPPAAHDAAGAVALLGAAFELDRPTALELAGAHDVVQISIGRAGTIDPLAHSPGARVAIELDPGDPDAGNARASTEVVRAARCIVLGGGSYLDWYKVLTLGGAPSRVGLALQEAHASGANVLASGAAAAFLGEWTVLERALAERPVRNPRDATGRWFLAGLGLVRGSLVDSSAIAGGAPDRVVRSAFRAHLDRGIFLEGEVAWILGARGEARVVGPGAVLLFDLSRARRSRAKLSGARLALLFDGDRSNARTHAVPAATEPLRCAAEEQTERAVASVLDAGFLVDRLLADEPCGRFADPERQLVIGADEDSFATPAGPGRRSARAGLRIDLEWLQRGAAEGAGSPK